jgi:hypothetical protein
MLYSGSEEIPEHVKQVFPQIRDGFIMYSGIIGIIFVANSIVYVILRNFSHFFNYAIHAKCHHGSQDTN